GEIFSVAILFIAGALLAIYPQLLCEYLAFPVNVFATDGESARVLLTEYLGLWRLWPAGVAFVIAAAALVARVRLPEWRRARLLLWTIVVALGIVTLPRSPHPFLHSLKEEAVALVARSERVVPSLRRPPRRTNAAPAATRSLLETSKSLTADHVFLIVLEGVTSADFENAFLNANSKFFARVSDRAAFFRRYYATNLDSYTSLIAMLTSVQVPYRAYADESLYGAVNQTANLTRSLRDLGFFTMFVSTYAHQPFVPTRNDWDRVLDRGDLPSLEGWVSLGSSRMEAATEDRAALSTVVDAAARHPRTFVLHELIYGHSTEWRAKTGQTQLAYYNAYLRDLLDRLEAKGLGPLSLLVIVSDHGDRAKASVAENYRVPLLVVGARVPPGGDTEFRSHLDLQSIVVSYLTKTGLPPPRTETYVVGSTERWVYGAIKANGEYLFIDDEPGAVLSVRGGLDASRLRETFQSSLNEFGALFGQ
ncbi:MAG: sulfatase, partial [Thermodesulfobacteriota bacterium]